MLESVAVVFGSYLLSVVLVLATDPLLSRLFPGDFVQAGFPLTLLWSRALRSSSSYRFFAPGSAPALHQAARRGMCSGFSSSGK
jgi:hypothetical protein